MKTNDMKTNGSQGWASPYVSVEATDAGVEIPEVGRIEAGAQQMSWGGLLALQGLGGSDAFIRYNRITSQSISGANGYGGKMRCCR